MKTDPAALLKHVGIALLSYACLHYNIAYAESYEESAVYNFDKYCMRNVRDFRMVANAAIENRLNKPDEKWLKMEPTNDLWIINTYERRMLLSVFGNVSCGIIIPNADYPKIKSLVGVRYNIKSFTRKNLDDGFTHDMYTGDYGDEPIILDISLPSTDNNGNTRLSVIAERRM